jgi:NAD(P)-dependent dehydrogenase (short-subunit alcohol dehydrogenase family)
MQNDLAGFMNVIQPVVTHMRESGGGSLVHVSSAGLGRTPPRDALSVAPKAAIDALMKTIATEEGEHGIRANSIGVGVIEAGIFKRLEAEGVFDENWKAAVKGALPLKCFGEAEDIANAAVFFASARSKYITGQTLFVDGGYSA